MPPVALSDVTAGRLLRKLGDNRGPAVPGHAGGYARTVYVRCEADDPATLTGVGAECYPGVIVRPQSGIHVEDQSDAGAVWLTLIARDEPALPVVGAVYACQLGGMLAVGDDLRPRAFGGFPTPNEMADASIPPFLDEYTAPSGGTPLLWWTFPGDSIGELYPLPVVWTARPRSLGAESRLPVAGWYHVSGWYTASVRFDPTGLTEEDAKTRAGAPWFIGVESDLGTFGSPLRAESIRVGYPIVHPRSDLIEVEIGMHTSFITRSGEPGGAGHGGDIRLVYGTNLFTQVGADIAEFRSGMRAMHWTLLRADDSRAGWGGLTGTYGG